MVKAVPVRSWLAAQFIHWGQEKPNHISRLTVGRFEKAHEGDIFLDEIGDLPLATQTKLLRVLEEKVIERVGSSSPIKTDVRLISATNQDLLQLVEQGGYRKDFYFRINGIPLFRPPSRQRVHDKGQGQWSLRQLHIGQA